MKMLGGFLSPHAFPDTAMEAGYHSARERWLRPRQGAIAVSVAGLFMIFALLDSRYAPGYEEPLLEVRIAVSASLMCIILLARLQPDRVRVDFVLGAVATTAYAGVLIMRVLLGDGSTYNLLAGMLLIQTGVWFLSGLSLRPAALVNIIGLAAYAMVSAMVGHRPIAQMDEELLYLLAGGFVGGIASLHIERLFRQNFETNNRLVELERDSRLRAQRDGMTGLWNHQAMIEHISASVTAGKSGAIIMLDLEDFKLVNDTHGHLAGDQVLIATARRISATLRPEDIAGRVGGDEFLVLIGSRADPDHIRAAAERIRAEIDQPFRLQGDRTLPPVKVAASVGLALLGETGTDAQALFALADQRMYADKQARKGQLRRTDEISPA